MTTHTKNECYPKKNYQIIIYHAFWRREKKNGTVVKSQYGPNIAGLIFYPAMICLLAVLTGNDLPFSCTNSDLVPND